MKKLVIIAGIVWLGLNLGLQAQQATASSSTNSTNSTAASTVSNTTTSGSASSNSTSSGSLQTVVVQDSAIVSDRDTALFEQSQTAGTATLVKEESVTEKKRVQTTADLLNYQAGVFAQAVDGNDSERISIRGSGLNRGANGGFREGIEFLFDGLPITGPGGTPYELLEPLGLDYTEILQGPAGIKYGAVDLGGAINFATETGYTASPFEVRGEAGSYGYYKGEASSGGVEGNVDYFVSVVDETSHGFQQQADGKATRFISNIGYKFNDDWDTRIYFRFGYTDNQLPGSLTLHQTQTTPYQANPTNLASNTERRQPGSKWLADKTTWKVDDDSKVEFGIVYHDYPIVALNGFQTAVPVASAPGLPAPYKTAIPAAGILARQDWEFVDIDNSVRYTRGDQIAGHQSNSSFGLVSSEEVDGEVWNIDTNNNEVLKENSYGGSANHTIFATNETELVPKFWLTSGAEGVHIRRESIIQVPVDSSYIRDSYYFAPQAGLQYRFDDDNQVYFNASQNIEPTDDWKYSGATLTGGLWTENRLNLDDQQARTIEIGDRFKQGIFSGNVALYRSWLTHELLQENIPIPGSTLFSAVNFNADHTVHQGIEVNLGTQLWREVVPGRKDSDPQTQITYQQSYTLSDFYNQSNPVVPGGGKQLPGLPEHFYQGELLYEHDSGFFAGLNTQVSSSYEADYGDFLAVPDYQIFGSTIGYASAKNGWNVHLDLQNFTDQKYVVAPSPLSATSSANLANTSAIFQPGDGFTIIGGFGYSF